MKFIKLLLNILQFFTVYILLLALVRNLNLQFSATVYIPTCFFISTLFWTFYTNNSKRIYNKFFKNEVTNNSTVSKKLNKVYDKILDPNKVRAKKMMLLFALLSITMTFAGLTSAYIVSKGRPDWLVDFELPILFFYSTILLVISSVTIQVSKYNLINNKSKKNVLMWLSFTLILGVLFCILQFLSFKNLIEMGYFFAGAQSTITTSFIYVLTFLHAVHLFAGIIVLMVLIYNTNKDYYQVNKLGFTLGVTFWHFLDILWLYLFLFFYFFG